MAAVLPSSSVLRLHILRSNMVTSLWKRSMSKSFKMSNISQQGWDLNINVQRVKDVFPTDMGDILLREEYEKIDEYLDENDGESSIDNKEDY